MHTTLQPLSAIHTEILPPRVPEQLIGPYHVDVRVRLHDVHAIPSPKMWAINQENPAIEISDTLKTKGRERFLALCTVILTTWTISPLNVDNIHGSAASRQTNVGVV